jgi:hypothetical protein
VGIRFRCHHCESELHVKDFQGGKRGRCPQCQGRFRVPLSDADHSLPPDGSVNDGSANEEAQLENATTSSTASDVQTRQSTVEQTKRQTTEQSRSPSQTLSVGVGKPQQLNEFPEAKWFVRPSSGGQFGPATNDSMWQWLQENRIDHSSLVWREGWNDWLESAEVFADFYATAEVPAESPGLPTSRLEDEPVGSKLQQAQATTNAMNGKDSPAPLSERNRALRKQKRRRNYAVMIAILSVVMLALIVALVLVLSTQQA